MATLKQLAIALNLDVNSAKNTIAQELVNSGNNELADTIQGLKANDQLPEEIESLIEQLGLNVTAKRKKVNGELANTPELVSNFIQAIPTLQINQFKNQQNQSIQLAGNQGKVTGYLSAIEFQKQQLSGFNEAQNNFNRVLARQIDQLNQELNAKISDFYSDFCDEQRLMSDAQLEQNELMEDWDQIVGNISEAMGKHE